MCCVLHVYAVNNIRTEHTGLLAKSIVTFSIVELPFNNLPDGTLRNKLFRLGKETVITVP